MYEIFEQLLNSFNISAYKFCKDTGVSQSTISTWKRKKNLINGDTAKVIADYFNVSLEYLMTGKEKEGGETYYINEETREIAQDIFENKDLRMLFDVAKDSTPERLKAYYNMIRELERQEKGED
ncbi:helix-turn-helix domain-containing protein [Anaerostipes caccae]|uniref:helix-turn-helix domain-containing protein n=1 Tax=Anaerostipes caccae TaxID=105841 RepID=UPI0020542320|nr:MAG TPA: helix-turn-helix domain protein [Caudoviricetes sp.]